MSNRARSSPPHFALVAKPRDPSTARVPHAADSPVASFAKHDVDWSILMARAQSGDGEAYRRLLRAITPCLRARGARRQRPSRRRRRRAGCSAYRACGAPHLRSGATVRTLAHRDRQAAHRRSPSARAARRQSRTRGGRLRNLFGALLRDASAHVHDLDASAMVVVWNFATTGMFALLGVLVGRRLFALPRISRPPRPRPREA